VVVVVIEVIVHGRSGELMTESSRGRPVPVALGGTRPRVDIVRDRRHGPNSRNVTIIGPYPLVGLGTYVPKPTRGYAFS